MSWSARGTTPQSLSGPASASHRPGSCPAWESQAPGLATGMPDVPPGGRDAAGWGVHRVMGTETEFGIHAPTNPHARHTVLSVELVNAYADLSTRSGLPVAGTEWDYTGESPLIDARGWRMPRSAAHPSQLTDEALVGPDGEPVHLLNSTVLANGARWYVDHAHPEYSAPETTNPWEAMVWDAAGDRIAQAAAEHIAATQHGAQVRVYKNNVDGKGACYGAHENYLVARALDFDELAAVLLPFFAARQVLVGAGRVGVGAEGEEPGFQLSQRADYIEEQIGLETTIHRPIVNTRDEPHANADAYRRLHVIIGDATLSQHATWLRMGMTALVLAMAEAGTAPRLELLDPVAALRTISRDPSLRASVPARRWSADGTSAERVELSGVQILAEYREAARAHCDRFGADAATDRLLRAWEQDLEDARTDPLRLADRVDWAAKLRLMRGMIDRAGTGWADPRLAMADLQYADLSASRGLHSRLVSSGAVRELAEPERIAAAVQRPPRTTRAWLRGNLVAAHSSQVVGAAWDSLLLRLEPQAPLWRLSLAEPLRGRAAELPAWWHDDERGPRPNPRRLREELERLLATRRD